MRRRRKKNGKKKEEEEEREKKRERSGAIGFCRRERERETRKHKIT